MPYQYHPVSNHCAESTDFNTFLNCATNIKTNYSITFELDLFTLILSLVCGFVKGVILNEPCHLQPYHWHFQSTPTGGCC